MGGGKEQLEEKILNHSAALAEEWAAAKNNWKKRY